MTALCKVALVAIITTSLTAPAAFAAEASGDDDPGSRMVEAFNDARAKRGLPPLREAPKLMRTARGYAGHLIRSDSFGHGSSYARAGFRQAGEILAMNRGWSRRTGPALRMWLHSPGHAALILSRSFRYVGVGPARGNFGGAPTTIWVAHFGAR